MNSIHDMGGMHGFGLVPWVETEPVFHDPWEGRMFGILLTLGPQGVHDPRGLRDAMENMDPAQYLGLGYYERWLAVTEKALIAKGFLTAAELDQKTDAFRSRPDTQVSRREDRELRDRMLHAIYTRDSPHQDVGIKPRFKVGDSVTARNVHAVSHTRLPRYVRGKRGVIALFHGVHDIHDTQPNDKKIPPQPVYNVRFEGQELWGESAEPHQGLYLDMWESYLESA
jgi:nitrile hydratase beta subunit